jgi:uncharacterized protein (DUF1697 family)
MSKTTYAAFLRGMNLGGRRITNSDLAAAVSGIGFEEVETFRASGNVIFAADRGTEASVSNRLEKGLADSLGYEVPVFLRSAAEVQAISSCRPFKAAQLDASKGKLQVVMLLRKPLAKARRKALALATDDDLLAIEGRELYWLPSGGISDSELDLKGLEAALGLTTTRTMGTVEQIAAKHLA